MHSSIPFRRRALTLLPAVLFTFSAPLQAQQGLVALYTFQEGSGNTVQDVSGAGNPLDLVISNPDAVDWLPDGGVNIRGGSPPAIIASPGPATKVIDAVKLTHQMTVEALIKPANLTQDGPARMVTISPTPSARNYTMGQQGAEWQIRRRTTSTDNNAGPAIHRIGPGLGGVELRLIHLVYTRDEFGLDTLYIDGVELGTNMQFGDFSNWDDSYRLGLGAELDLARPWLGEMHRIAIYDRALTAAEVAQNFDELMPKLDITEVSPADGTLFHPAQDGISFRAVALADNTIAQSGVRLTLNGVDRSNELQFTGDNTNWQVTFSALNPDQVYHAEISIEDNAERTRLVLLDFETFSLRADGLIVLYTFEEGDGSIILDQAEAGSPLNLTIADTSNVRWIEGRGLAIDSPVRIASSKAADKIKQPVQASNELTVEAWIRSTALRSGPARIVTFSEYRQFFGGSESDNSLRNFTLGQEDDTYSFHLRTTDTDVAGRPPLLSPEVVIDFPTQVVYTRDAGGQAYLYIDGQEVASSFVGGDFSNWLEGKFLGLATELNQIVPQGPTDNPFRRWLGEFYRVAIYHRALSSAEVLDHFNEFRGDDTTPPTAPQNLAVQAAGAVFAGLTWDASIDESGGVLYEVERNGEIIATVAETSFLDRGVSPNTTYTYRVRALGFWKDASDFSDSVQVTTGGLTELAGVVKAEFYTDIPGNRLTDLTVSPKFPDQPDVTMFLPAVETPLNWGNEYGVRVSGWFVPPQTGDYVFFMASDDDGEFWLSTDADPANRVFVAFEPQWNTFRNWTGTERRNAFNPENRTDMNLWSAWMDRDPVTGLAVITLVQGQSYYFEALMKEASGDDHISVTYKLRDEPDPVNGTPTRMTGDVIRALADPDFVAPLIVTPPQSQNVSVGQSVTLTVELAEISSGPFTYQWHFEGTEIAGATESSYTIESFQAEDSGLYTVAVSNISGSVTSQPAFLGPFGNSLLALYMFQEGSGTVVRDVSGVGMPLDLTIGNLAAVRWLEGGGLALDENVLIASPGPATKIYQACRASGEFTIEVWATPGNLTQDGPARLVTVSADTSNRNITLGQQADFWQMRTRTPTTGANGTGGPGALNTDALTVETRLTHVLFTRDIAGNETIYLDGVVAANRTVTGDFSNWNPNYRLGLGAELNNMRHWLGELHRVAIYSYALPQEEVTANFAAGPDAPGPEIQQPVIQTHPQSQAVALGQPATLSVELADLTTGPFTYQWRFQGIDILGATQPTYSIPSFQTEHAGDYDVVVSNNAGSVPSLTATLAPHGLLALYTFEEGSGNIVADRSGTGTPLDLEISNLGNVRWLEGGGLAVDNNTLIASPGPATKIIQAVKVSQELTVEAWITPENLSQEGPARIVTISPTTSERNYTMGQQNVEWQIRRRTTATDNNAGPAEHRIGPGLGGVELRLIHLVHTRDQSGTDVLYLDGVELGTNQDTPGDFSNWDESYRLGVASELDLARPWLGELHRIAIYNVALTAGEVSDNFAAGPHPVDAQVLLLNPQVVGDSFQFQLATAMGMEYVVEYRNELTDPAWTELTTITGDGTVQTVTDASLNQGSRFYQVRLKHQ